MLMGPSVPGWLSVTGCLPPSLCRQVNVSVPEPTRANGTLFAVVYVHRAGVSPLEDSREVHYAAQLTTYITPAYRDGQRDTQKVKRYSTSVIVIFSAHRVTFTAGLEHMRLFANKLFLWLH